MANNQNNEGKGKPWEMDENASEQVPKVDAQLGSLFFQRLPQEIRDLIYTELFSSTTFTSGERKVGLFCGVKIKPAPNGLALLRTCRRARLEIGDSWLGQVLFDFESTEAMLDKLNAIPQDTLARIRHVRVRGGGLYLRMPNKGFWWFTPAMLFKLLPGLQLDQLTVLGGTTSERNYRLLNDFIQDTNGWKTLRFVAHSSEMLGYSSRESWPHEERRLIFPRKAQPQHWQGVVEARDGAASRPSVTVYHAKGSTHYDKDHPPCVHRHLNDTSAWVKFEQDPRDYENLPSRTWPEDHELMNGDGKGRSWWWWSRGALELTMRKRRTRRPSSQIPGGCCRE
jgi:hypothetical protein